MSRYLTSFAFDCFGKIYIATLVMFALAIALWFFISYLEDTKDLNVIPKILTGVMYLLFILSFPHGLFYIIVGLYFVYKNQDNIDHEQRETFLAKNKLDVVKEELEESMEECYILPSSYDDAMEKLKTLEDENNKLRIINNNLRYNIETLELSNNSGSEHPARKRSPYDAELTELLDEAWQRGYDLGFEDGFEGLN